MYIDYHDLRSRPRRNTRYREQHEDEFGYNKFARVYGNPSFQRNLICNCGWEEAIAAALAVAGTGTQIAANNQTQSAMNQATQQQINAQNDYAKKGQQVFQQSLDQSTPQAAKQQIGQGQQQAAQSIANAQSIPLTAQQPSFGNVNTAQESARQGLSNNAASNYFGQSNFGLQQYLKDLQAQSQFGVIGGQSGQSARNFGSNLSAASQAGNNLGALGSLLGTGGSVLGSYAASQAPQQTGFNQIGNYPMSAAMLSRLQQQQLTPQWGQTFTQGLQ